MVMRQRKRSAFALALEKSVGKELFGRRRAEQTIKAAVDLRRVFKPYQGDLFGTNDDTTDGLLYLSRIDADEDPLRRAAKRVGAEAPRERQQEYEERESPAEAEVAEEAQSPEEIAGLQRKRRFAIALATMSAKKSKRKDMLAHGAVDLLFRLLRERDREILSSCGKALSQLSTDEAMHPALTASGRVTALLALCKGASKIVKQDFARTLCNLGSGVGCEERMAREGAFTALTIVGTSSMVSMEISLTAVLNICSSSDSRYFDDPNGPTFPRLEELDEAIMQLTAYRLSPTLEYLLLCCLVNASAMRGNTMKLTDDGIVRYILRTALDASEVESQRHCARVLYNLSRCARSRGKIADERRCDPLFALAAHDDKVVKELAAVCVARLAIDSATRDKVVRYGITKVLLDLCEVPFAEPLITRLVMTALTALAESRHATTFIGEGGVERLLKVLRQGSVDVVVGGVQCMCVLVTTPEGLLALKQKGALHVMIHRGTVTNNIVEPIAFACYTISTSQHCDKDLAGAVQKSVTLLATTVAESAPASQEEQRWNANILTTCAEIYYHLTNVQNFDASEMIPLLIQLLSGDANDAVKGFGAAALCNLAKKSANRKRLLQPASLKQILELARVSEQLLTKVQCAALLSLLTADADEEDRRRIAEAQNFVPTVLSLAALEHRDTQTRCVIALFNLTRTPDTREAVRGARGAHELLVSLAGDASSETLRRGCAAALCNLSAVEGSERGLVCDYEIVHVLLLTAFVATTSTTTRFICMKTLFNVFADDSLHRRMLDHGALWAFAQMTRHEDKKCYHLCANALANLSALYPQEFFHKGNGAAIAALLKLMNARESHPDACFLGLVAVHQLMKWLLGTNATEVDHEFFPAVLRALESFEFNARKHPRVVDAALCVAASVSQVPEERGGFTHQLLEQVLTGASHGAHSRVGVHALQTLICNVALNVADDVTGIKAVVGVVRSIVDVVDNEDIPALAVAIACTTFAAASVAGFETVILRSLTNALQRYDLSTSADGTRALARAVATATFNLSQLNDVRTKIVAHGAGALLRRAYDVSRDQDVKILCGKACANMAFGKIHSAKFVESGVANILVYAGVAAYGDARRTMLTTRSSSTLAKVDEQEDVKTTTLRRLSGAYRNFLAYPGNHAALIDSGIIKVLCDFSVVPDEVVQANSAAALRFMTFKTASRKALVESNAMSIVLTDGRRQRGEDDAQDDDDLGVNEQLLCDIEEETWFMGNRGGQRERKCVDDHPWEGPSITEFLERLRLPDYTNGAFRIRDAKIWTSDGWKKSAERDAELDTPPFEQFVSETKAELRKPTVAAAADFALPSQRVIVKHRCSVDGMPNVRHLPGRQRKIVPVLQRLDSLAAMGMESDSENDSSEDDCAKGAKDDFKDESNANESESNLGKFPDEQHMQKLLTGKANTLAGLTDMLRRGPVLGDEKSLPQIKTPPPRTPPRRRSSVSEKVGKALTEGNASSMLDIITREPSLNAGAKRGSRRGASKVKVAAIALAAVSKFRAAKDSEVPEMRKLGTRGDHDDDQQSTRKVTVK